MTFLFFIKCFAVGLVGNLTLGPVFILTFHHSVRYGFLRGFATATASAVADGVLFGVGLLSALSLVQQIRVSKPIIFLVGSIVLLGLGLSTFFKEASLKEAQPGVTSSASVIVLMMKAFFMTVLNPLTVAYFTAASVGVLSGVHISGVFEILVACGTVALGTLSALAVVSFVSSRVGSRLDLQRLAAVTHLTGLIFIAFGCYLLYRFFSALNAANSFF